jgi:hypothetical protein
MDIHKPKPWHGVREFLKEFAIIVLGVFVALGAEQTAEGLHRQAEVREARDALHAEIADDMMWAQFNQRREVCGARELERYVAWAEGAPPPPPAGPAAQRLLMLNAATWDEVKTGPVSAMPLKERLALARFYGQVGDYNTMADRERTAGLRMAESYGLKRMTPEDRTSLERAVFAFRAVGNVMQKMTDGITYWGAQTGVKAAPAQGQMWDELADFCRAVGVK